MVQRAREGGASIQPPSLLVASKERCLETATIWEVGVKHFWGLTSSPSLPQEMSDSASLTCTNIKRGRKGMDDKEKEEGRDS